VNVVGFAYAVFSFFWSFWPNTVVEDFVEDFNWAPVIFVAVLLFCLLLYGARARKVYTGPVAMVRFENSETEL